MSAVLQKKKPTRISVVGGNVAGLSAAYHLAQRGFNVRVYEARIWNKPCGGAISCEFAGYLENELGVRPQGADHFVPGLRLSFRDRLPLDVKGFFVVVRRMELQQKLIERLRQEPNIDFVFKRVSVSEPELFSPQTILASGYSGFTRRVLRENWKQPFHWIIFRFDGYADSGPQPNRHLMVFDSRVDGYGWVFIGKDRHINIGFGGISGRQAVRRRYEEFLESIERKHGYHIHLGPHKPEGWKIPVLFKNWKHPVSFKRKGVEFIGAGDVLGLAHPVIGAGIEPAWQSGLLLAACADPGTGVIDTGLYSRLLKRNLLLTSRRPIHQAMTAAAKSGLLPGRDVLAYIASFPAAPYIIRSLKKYPWFAMVHDGKTKTGYTATA